ncbi:ShlB/FhaC/HecB family hemolysin secretion/activation protein [Variovorax sp. H27-G14]|uniref:ShlB/FhaC/HecB family hemolysin secretion/activation protein n=1 Tax=Variovorax sp. H27-G14 TaxID=3111914 RepID=UPI0038FC167E
MINRSEICKTFGAFLCAAFAAQAMGQVLPADAAAQNEQRQRLQLNEARARAAEAPRFLTYEQAAPSGPLVFPREEPCFQISRFALKAIDEFQWLRKRVPIEGRCLGAQGLLAVRAAVAKELIAEGYVTTRVVIPEQNLSQGELTLEIVAGRVGKVRDEDGSIGWHRTVLPVAEGDVFNVRDLDQALENMRRLPGQGATRFELLPGAEADSVDIAFRHPEDARRVRATFTADNSGVDAVGRHQLGAVVSIDSPLGLYDQLIATIGSDSRLNKGPKGSASKSVAWNVPVGRVSFAIGASESESTQLLDVEGLKIPYATRTRRLEAGVSYVPYRTATSKGMLRFAMFRRQENGWFAGEALDVQRRDMVGYEIGAGHFEKLGPASLEFGVALRGSLPGQSRLPGSVLGQEQWSGRYRLATASVAATVPFEVDDQNFGYRGGLLLQHAPVPVPSSEYLQLGGRYSVRGFDGNRTLSAQGGWLWRNELATPAWQGSEAYVALDVGAVSGHGTQQHTQNAQRTLAGTAIGVRGGHKQWGYDLSVGLPLVRPASFGRQKPFLNFLLTASFL